ncbi:DUF2794 domain-containing protein [Ochrobactrum sp. Marseille-Q0166]|uniref:DUF2794 domain-containing protein n=1 Tax=Ochrobactrum sp. Marseille-Q0166 TaxID=2761105 RepID=UPI001655D078|nr:DUF2794 domain-containing protein [Ochrobactrum sp. Marseille-Q0166]MBC8716149.1 DUF2794 domain-containing protein [Ochrobactrum sp. Marseille-Q0166]
MNIPSAANEEKSSPSTSHSSATPKVVPFSQPRPISATVSFDRHELGKILNIYGRMVATGAWKDYAIDHLADRAVFSIFRRASEVPLFRIEKSPKLAQKQGAYSVISASGLIMKRGHELERVLRVFDKSLKLVGN